MLRVIRLDDLAHVLLRWRRSACRRGFRAARSRAWAHGDGLRVGVMNYMKPSCHPKQLTLLGEPLKVLTEVLDPVFGLTVLFGKDARDGVGSGWRR